MRNDGGADNNWIISALERYDKQLLRYTAWLLDDVEQAKDVVQEAFLRLCREQEETVGDRLPQWLFTVRRNLAFDLLKKEGKSENLDDTRRLDEKEISLVREAIEQKELLDEVLRLVEELPKNQREVVYLRFQGGFSYREISQVTHLSVGNVGFLIHSAMESIRRIRAKDPANHAATRRSHEV